MDMIIKCSSVAVTVEGDGYNRRAILDISEGSLQDTVDAADIVDEYGAWDLLDAMKEGSILAYVSENIAPIDVIRELPEDECLDAIGESSIINWLESNGYTVEK